MRGHVRRPWRCPAGKRCSCGRCAWCYVVDADHDPASGKRRQRWITKSADGVRFRTKSDADAACGTRS